MGSILVSEWTLERLRGLGRCEWCRQWGALEPHHAIKKRGMGGGARIDHPFNLLAVDRRCHVYLEAHGHLEAVRQRVRRLIAQREGVAEATIVEYLMWLLRVPKDRRPHGD
jgi:hypothetical protein